MDVHPSRLNFYADCSLEGTGDLSEHIGAPGMVPTVSKLNDYRWSREKKDSEVLVTWRCLESIEDSWEPTQQLRKDIPVLLKQYAVDTKDQKFVQHVNKDGRSKILSTRPFGILRQAAADSDAYDSGTTDSGTADSGEQRPGRQRGGPAEDSSAADSGAEDGGPAE
ncbi:hypothetical protein ON010_g9133 [Phytophthora cinnamomi]|nr:hypothetical protein ON010_g9133 [Phytophthora cinnamomi]